VTDEGMRRKLADTTEYGKFIAQSGACIVVFCEESTYYLEDGSAAIQNILVAGQALGIGTCWVAGDKKPYADTIRQMLGLPEKYRLIGLIAAGYATDSPSPNKKTLGEVIHWERYTP
jgi:nitroreductase